MAGAYRGKKQVIRGDIGAVGEALSQIVLECKTHSRANIVRIMQNVPLEAQRLIAHQTYPATGLRIIHGKLVRDHAPIFVEKGNNLTVGIRHLAAYAAAHEFGFKGTVTVRAHIRKVKSRDVWGKLGGRRKKLARGISSVRTHPRDMEIIQRAFLRPALSMAAAEAMTKLKSAEGVTF